jgi:hypothetical protein
VAASDDGRGTSADVDADLGDDGERDITAMAAPFLKSRSTGSAASRVTSASLPRPALRRAGPWVGLTPKNTLAVSVSLLA